jgi:ribosome maturation factor RimP
MDSNELENIVARELEVLGFECVKLEVVGTKRSPIVRLYIDRSGGVSIKDCAMVSRTVGLLLDPIDPFPGRYLLEVSSPGSSRPLTRAEHFARFAGCEARVQCSDAELGMDTDSGQQLIRLSDVVKANLTGQEYKIDKKQKRSKKNKGE